MAHARMLPASRANQHHARNMNRAFPFEDASADILLRIRPRVLLDDVRVLDRHRVLRRIHGEHLAGLAL